MRTAKHWVWVGIAVMSVGGLQVGKSGVRAAWAEEATAARVQDLVGTWLFVEDRTPDPTPEMANMRPPAGARFSVSLDGEVLVLEQTRRDKPYVMRYPLDGSEQVKVESGATHTHSGCFEAGVWHSSIRIDAPGRDPDTRVVTTSNLTLAASSEGLTVTHAFTAPIKITRVAFYKKVADVASPTPASADVSALAWLSGAWVGSQGKASIEERWGPPGGGALLGTARAVVGDKMVNFEFLRIVERAGGLVYIAQPGGASPTEFVLTAISPTRAVFENPYHDYPQRIVYEREGERGLTTEISDSSGQSAHRASYTRE